jgi:flagellar basal-body rod protein FlgC
LISLINSSLSGLSAFTRKMRVISNNIANVNTDGYKKRRALFSEGANGGVDVTVTRIDSPGPPILDAKDYPMVEKEMSNVDLTEEIPQMMLTQRGYEANLKTLKIQDEMIGALLDVRG